jgi:hypothetical protein
MLRPQEIPIPSSKGDGTFYLPVTPTLFNDPICDCPGFNFRGKCKHVTKVAEDMCEFHRIPTKIELKKGVEGMCPDCTSRLVLYELDPEFD